MLFLKELGGAMKSYELVWRDTKKGFAIAFDYDLGHVLIGKNVSLFPENAMWETEEIVRNGDEWDLSPRSKMVDETTDEDIRWFFIDHSKEEKQAAQ